MMMRCRETLRVTPKLICHVVYVILYVYISENEQHEGDCVGDDSRDMINVRIHECCELDYEVKLRFFD